MGKATTPDQFNTAHGMSITPRYALTLSVRIIRMLRKPII
jgi:hypothetical protein